MAAEDKQLFTQRELYKEFYAVPEGMRKDRFFTEDTHEPIVTDTDFGRAFNVHPKTLYRWSKEPDFIQHVYNIRRERMERGIPEVIEALMKQAGSGNMTAIKMVLEFVGMDVLGKNTDEDISIGDNPFNSEGKITYFALELAEHLVKSMRLDVLPDKMANVIAKYMIETALPKEESLELD